MFHNNDNKITRLTFVTINNETCLIKNYVFQDQSKLFCCCYPVEEQNSTVGSISSILSMEDDPEIEMHAEKLFTLDTYFKINCQYCFL